MTPQVYAGMARVRPRRRAAPGLDAGPTATSARRRPIGIALGEGDESARLEHPQQERRGRRRPALDPRRLVAEQPLGDVDDEVIAVVHEVGRIRDLERRERDLEAVPIEGARERLRDDAADPGRLERLRGDRAPRRLPEVVPRDDDVARLHLDREARILVLEHVPHDLGHRLEHVARLHERVGRDVVAELPAPALEPGREPAHAATSAAPRNARGSAIRPSTADAATVAAEARYIDAFGLPLRPGKLRAWVEIIASPAAIAPMFA